MQAYDLLKFNQIDCKAGTTAEGQNFVLANISTSRASLLQGHYLVQEKY